ncbi:MAG: MBL fold metallo-hydrolase [Oscillospiraceae bacterium]|nr:MBL fold metallo-hydrolase [Oscillospiraceae bacterium]
MLQIHTLILGDYQTNCYLVWDDAGTSCAVIDPGYNAQAVLQKADQLGLTIDAVLLTHGHFDHVGGVEEIVKATGCKLWMSQSDWSQVKNPVTAYLYPIANCDFTEVCFCEDGESIHAGGLDFTVMATPGHTYGSVCFLCGNALFSGDTLFAGSCGRTDLPGGSWATITESLHRLAAIDQDYTVYPGHGESTNLASEKRYNSYLR